MRVSVVQVKMNQVIIADGKFTLGEYVVNPDIMEGSPYKDIFFSNEARNKFFFDTSLPVNMTQMFSYN